MCGLYINCIYTCLESDYTASQTTSRCVLNALQSQGLQLPLHLAYISPHTNSIFFWHSHLYWTADGTEAEHICHATKVKSWNHV